MMADDPLTSARAWLAAAPDDDIRDELAGLLEAGDDAELIERSFTFGADTRDQVELERCGRGVQEDRIRVVAVFTRDVLERRRRRWIVRSENIAMEFHYGRGDALLFNLLLFLSRAYGGCRQDFSCGDLSADDHFRFVHLWYEAL